MLINLYLAFNDVSAIVLEICSRVSNHIQAKISFIPISALNSLNIFKDTKYSNESPLSWFKGPSLVEKLNQISMSIQTPVYKFFRRPSFVVISTKELTVKRKQKKKHPNDPYKIIIGYVTGTFF
jgi:translation elongation factor EF-1alpha